jgi:hypothetical protein
MNWGVSDWKNADAYPAYEHRDYLEWWREFTRRRPDYRRLWVERTWYKSQWDLDERKRLSIRMTGDEKYERWFVRAILEEDDYIALGFIMPFMLPPDTCFPEGLLCSSVYTTTQRRWPDVYKGLYNYAKSESHAEILNTLDEYRWVESQRRKAGWVGITFDLNRPIEEQLKLAREALLRWQAAFNGHDENRHARMIKPQCGLWPIYLRVLDAHESSATLAEIATTLWPGQKKRHKVRATLEGCAEAPRQLPTEGARFVPVINRKDRVATVCDPWRDAALWSEINGTSKETEPFSPQHLASGRVRGRRRSRPDRSDHKLNGRAGRVPNSRWDTHADPSRNSVSRHQGRSISETDSRGWKHQPVVGRRIAGVDRTRGGST